MFSCSLIYNHYTWCTALAAIIVPVWTLIIISNVPYIPDQSGMQVLKYFVLANSEGKPAKKGPFWCTSYKFMQPSRESRMKSGGGEAY